VAHIGSDAVPKKTCKYEYAIVWIACNDDNAETDLDVIKEQITVLMVADMFDRDPDEVAVDVLNSRRKAFDHPGNPNWGKKA
jgi:hypothetical protein